jgi:hypothetical protein
MNAIFVLLGANNVISKNASLVKSFDYLQGILPGMITKQLDPERVARVSLALLLAGANPSLPVIKEAAKYIAGLQRHDGGWANVEETLWATSFFNKLNNTSYDHVVCRAVSWLNSERHPNAGWGQTKRDQPRIPLTGLVMFLIPETNVMEVREWLERAAGAELAGPRVLSYKIAIPLMALSNDREWVQSVFCYKLKEALQNEQNPDGGFGPWRGHPIGSEVWSTAFAVIALTRTRVVSEPRDSLNAAITWLEKNQLNDGSWAYHFIDEGAALGCWALVEALKT